MPKKGKVSKKFTTKVSDIIAMILESDCNIEKLMVFSPEILQKAKSATGLAAS